MRRATTPRRSCSTSWPISTRECPRLPTDSRLLTLACNSFLFLDVLPAKQLRLQQKVKADIEKLLKKIKLHLRGGQRVRATPGPLRSSFMTCFL